VIQRRGVERLVEAAETRVAIIGIFAFRIGMMDQKAKPGAPGHGRPLQHLKIAVGIAECRNRTAASRLLPLRALHMSFATAVNVSGLIKIKAERKEISSLQSI